MSDNKSVKLTDQPARDLIFSRLDENILVEAAAGTGKTTCIVGRMIALLARGKCQSISTLAAVTFTRKAAAELRLRFQVALEKACQDAGAPEKERLGLALSQIETLFIGTIHSFCGSMLRTRPFEAGVDPAFTEIDDNEDKRLREQAWQITIDSFFNYDPQRLVAQLLELGLNIRELGSAFEKFAEFSDVEEWPLSKEELPDCAPIAKKVLDYVKHIKMLAPRLPAFWGNDKLIPKYRELPRLISHYENLSDPLALAEVLEHFNKNANITQKEWTKVDFSREDAKAELAHWQEFKTEVAGPFMRIWYERRYNVIIKIMRVAQKNFDALRRERGVLNYQDLLLKSARLLKNSEVREYFSKRCSHLLVDEFQDTDPIQAEVMLLLTSANHNENNWRKCVPRPGALFVVGDPKQSIYRFRRADIVTYNQVKRIIAGTGRVVSLEANFRTIREIIAWINGVFGPREMDAKKPDAQPICFPMEADIESPAYVALRNGRQDANEGDFHGVYSLTIPDEYGIKEEIIEYEAERIAQTIHQAIALKKTVSRSINQLNEGISKTVSPCDFMIVTKRKKLLSIYARALQKHGIPHQVSGSETLSESKELHLLYHYLRAVTCPDDPVALLAVLRGELFGVSDALLYSFKKQGGRFVYEKNVPTGFAGISVAFEMLRKHSRILKALPWAASLEKIVADLGLMVLPCLEAGGEYASGALAKAFELIRGQQSQIWSPTHLVEALGRLVNGEENYDGISIRGTEPDAVRIMNLHKVKGLEAPIVFLAGPYGESAHEPEIHIDRTAGKALGYLKISGEKKEYQAPLLAQAPGWEEAKNIEKSFQRAEELRLRYVAATRAGSALIITQSSRNKKRNPWHHFEPHLFQCELDEIPSLPTVETLNEPLKPDELEEAGKKINSALRICADKTYNSKGAREYALCQENITLDIPQYMTSSPHQEQPHGAGWGTVIHRLLQLAAQKTTDELLPLAQAYLEENNLSQNMAQTAIETIQLIQKADFWQRAQNAPRTFFEVPFTITNEDAASTAPLTINGCIDLVFEDENGWVIVDYKTDRVTSGQINKLIERYNPQLQLYAQAWERCSREKVSELALYFTQTSDYIILPRQGR